MKRVLSTFLVLLMVFSTILPTTAFAADDPGIGYSDGVPITEDAPEATPGETTPEDTPPASPTTAPEDDPAEVPPEDGSEESPGDDTADNPAGDPAAISGETCEIPQIAPFSEFVGEDNEYYTKIRLIVTDRQGNPLSGAVYGLYRTDGSFVEYLTTDYYGVAESSDVPVDTDYYLEEITPPAGFAPNTGRRDIILKEVCAPSRIDITVEYDPIMGYIEVVKTDEYGNPLPGVGFYVYSEATGQLVDTLLTNENGTATTIELPYGWYELYEYLTPEGYEGGGYTMARIEYDGETVTVYITNELSRAYVRVYKTGGDERVIQGAVFSIYTADGDWVEDITSGSGGYAYSSALVLGEYYLVEKSVPDGYKLDDTPHYFTLSYSWQTVYLDIVNERAGDPGRLKIIKTDENDNPLSDVVFGLYRAWDNKKLGELTTGADGTVTSDLLIPQDYYLVELVGKPGYQSNTGRIAFTVNQNGGEVVVVVVNPKECVFGKVRVIKQDDDGNPIPGVRFGLYCSKGNLIQEMVTGSDGTATSGILNAGDYYLVELSGIPGYASDTQQHPVSITNNNVTVPITIINPRVTGGVKVIKTGDSGEPLQGVVFGIFKDGGKIAELTTGADGTATSGALYYGAYELRELSTLPSYELLDISIPFSILTDGVIVEIPVTNPLIYGGVSILKTDESDNPLSGAVFGVYNAQGQLLAELTTDPDGGASMSGLVMGDYFLREHTAPAGFAPIGYDIPFTITTQGEVFEVTIPNIAGNGVISVIKTGEEDEPLSGVVFEVFRASNNEYVTVITTGEDGIAEAELPLGDYYLLETQTAEGYRLPEGSFSFSLTQHGVTVGLPIQNQKEPEPPAPGQIKLIKTDEGGNLLSGAVFSLYDAAIDEQLAELTTNDNGEVFFELPAGDYYLVEQTAPEGFVLDDTRIDTTVLSGEVTEITVINTPVPPGEPDPGSLKLIKRAEGTGTLLPGAVFTLHDAATDEQLAELISDETGEALFELPAGDYYLVEQTAPEGFVLDDTRIDATIRSGEVTEITVTNTPVPPAEPDPGTLKFIKKAEGTGALLPGAVFTLHDAATDEQLAELTTGADGTASFELSAGDYYLIEKTAPEGFILDDTRIDVTIQSGEVTEITVTNTPVPPAPPTTGKIQIVKKAQGTNALLPGAVFGVYEAATDIKVAELTTDENGEALTGELPAGAYYLLEKTAPAGYVLSADKIGATVKAGETVTIIVTNTPIPPTNPGDPEPGTVTVIKKAEDTDKRLSGAVFTIYRASTDRKVADVTTGRNGTVSYELEAGRYYLVEKTAPEGYRLNTDKISFTVKSGETKTITVYNTPKDEDADPTGTLYLVKKAEGTGARLPGAVFGIYKTSDNKKIAEVTTDSDGEVLYDLEPGSFYLRELKAPAGYVLESVSIPFTVKADSSVRVEVTNMREGHTGSVKLVKSGPDGEAVSGAVFGVYRASDNTKVAEIASGADGTALHELAPGAYYLLEKTAPSGYTLNTEKHSFSVSSGRTAEVRVTNQRTAPAPAPGVEEIPKTGEAFPYGSYTLAALFMALAVLCGAMLWNERRQKAKAN